MDRKNLMIYSPKERIPIGEAVITENGIHGIKVKWKRKNGNVEEFISVDKIQELIIAIIGSCSAHLRSGRIRTRKRRFAER